MTSTILLEGELADEFLHYLDDHKTVLKGITYDGKFQDTDPEKAGFLQLLHITIEFARDISVEVLATLLAEFVAKKIQDHLSARASKESTTPSKKLSIVGKDFDLYVENYSAEELKIILEAIKSGTAPTPPLH